MKLTSLLESTQEEIFHDYVLTNLLVGALRPPQREPFIAFYKKMKGKPKIAQYYLDTKMSQSEKDDFYNYYSEDLKNIKFQGDTIDLTYGLGMTIYAYDLIGPPPFKFPRNNEVYDFGLFQECSTLTEYPSWFPNHIARYSQVGSGISSLKNIHKVINSCGEMYFGSKEEIKNVSFLAEVKNLTNIEFAGKPEITYAVNKYLSDTKGKERSALDLQDLLIDSGFKQFA